MIKSPPEKAKTDAPPPTGEAAIAPEKRTILPAEKFFDKAVYGGISYAAQAGTGILLTKWLKYGSGKPYFEAAAKWLGPKLFRSKSIAAATEEISSPLMVSTMIMVGNSFIPPVKWLEDHKPDIVRKLTESENKKAAARGEPFTPQEIADQQKALAQLDQEPKQTWWSLIKARTFGLAAVYTVLFSIGNKRNEWAEKKSADAILGGMKAVGLKKMAENKTLEQYIHVGFLDVFYSMVSSGGLYVYSHFIDPPQKVKPAHQPLTPLVEKTEKAAVEVIDALSPDIHPPHISRDIQPRAKISEPKSLYTQKVTPDPDQPAPTLAV